MHVLVVVVVVVVANVCSSRVLQLLHALRGEHGEEVLSHRGAVQLVGERTAGRQRGVRRVPAVRDEAQVGRTLQGPRRLPTPDALERYHGERLPRQVDDEAEAHRMQLQPRKQRARLHTHLKRSVRDVIGVKACVVSSVARLTTGRRRRRR